MDNQIELAEQLDETLRLVLADAQTYAHGGSLEKQDPKRWIRIAKAWMQGTPVNDVRKICSNWDTVARVKAQLLESPACGDLKRELALRQIDSLETTKSLRKTAAERLAKKMEIAEEWDEINLEQAGRLYDRLTMAEDADTKTLMRLRGDNVQRVEVTRKDISFEDMLKELRELKDAEVIDVSE